VFNRSSNAHNDRFTIEVRDRRSEFCLLGKLVVPWLDSIGFHQSQQVLSCAEQVGDSVITFSLQLQQDDLQDGPPSAPLLWALTGVLCINVLRACDIRPANRYRGARFHFVEVEVPVEEPQHQIEAEQLPIEAEARGDPFSSSADSRGLSGLLRADSMMSVDSSA